ncbi:DNRLRE domain-containing protein, partial [Catellatospora tritici]|uniref:DNRLRE domain-containing protein n=1 Tax=Catellatospora tritici TaxID=2851566 RepID=UPI001C2D6C0D
MATVALSSLVVGVAAVPGGAAAASTAAVTAPAVDPDTLTVAQAVAQARKSGEPVVVTGSTTSTSELVARPDGGMSLSLNAQPVRKRIGTKWSRLDATLRPNADGSVSPAVTTAPVRLSGGGNGPFATMDGGAAGLSLSLPMTLPAPVLSGDTATYAEILPGVDLRVRVTDQGGVSEVLVVKDARAAHDPRLRELRMATRATGMTLRVDADGGLSGRDGFGQTLLRAQPPKMWDSTPVGDVPQVKGRIADGRPARSSAVAPGAAATVGRIGLAVGPDAITLTPDLALLTGAKTTYPVFIDPTPVWTPKSYNKTGWASVAQPYPSSSYWNDTPDPDGHMQVGNSGSMWSHTLINFALPTLAAGSTVHKATLRSREVWSWSCTASTVNVYAPTAYTLSSSNATWNYWNGKQGSVVDGQPEAHGYSSSCPAADVEFDVLSTVAARLGNTQTFLLMGSNEANDHNSWKEFDPNLTTLNLEYNQPPSTPTSLSTSPLTTCTGLTTIGDADVSLRAVVADPDGGSVGAGFELWKSSAPGTILYSTNPANFDFGSGSTAVAIVGKAVLENAAAGAVTTFSWRVRTYDGFSYSPAYSTTCQFKFDPTRAGPPGVTVAGGATVGASVQVTITPPVTGTAPTSYMYQLNAGTPVPVAAGQLTFAIVPTRFTNTITVTGLSAGGNVGDSASLTFTAQAGAPEAVDDLTMDGRADLLSTGRASNGLPGGLWLAKATSGNRLDQVAHDIGINGTGVFGTSSPHEYDAAASTATGTFTGGTQNDVLAYYPADTTLQRSG